MKKVFLILTGLLLASCASKSTLTKSSTSLDTTQQSVGLLSLEIGRSTPSRYIPKPRMIAVRYQDAEGKSQSKALAIDKDAGEATSESNNKFLISFALPPGNYKLEFIYGQANAFPFIGHFRLPLLMDFTLPSNSVVYFGNIHATLRPRVGEEFRAGSAIPLIDQSVTGISGSTFDVKVMSVKSDIDEFKKNYPALQKVDIKENTLPSFDRARVQEWWQTDGKSESLEK